MKNYTDIEQSKKLADILPLESADMYYACGAIAPPDIMIGNKQDYRCYTICWSLAALLSVLPFIDFTTPQLIGTPKALYRCMYNDDLKSHVYNNPVDACYEMIIKLKELNLL